MGGGSGALTGAGSGLAKAPPGGRGRGAASVGLEGADSGLAPAPPGGRESDLPGGLAPTVPDEPDSTLPDGLDSTLPGEPDSTLPDGLDSSLPDGLDSSLPDGMAPPLPGAATSRWTDTTSGLRIGRTLATSFAESLAGSLRASPVASVGTSLGTSRGAGFAASLGGGLWASCGAEPVDGLAVSACLAATAGAWLPATGRSRLGGRITTGATGFERSTIGAGGFVDEHEANVPTATTAIAAARAAPKQRRFTGCPAEAERSGPRRGLWSRIGPAQGAQTA